MHMQQYRFYALPKTRTISMFAIFSTTIKILETISFCWICNVVVYEKCNYVIMLLPQPQMAKGMVQSRYTVMIASVEIHF